MDEEEISLDTVMGTGEDGDRTPNPNEAPPTTDMPPAVDTPPAGDTDTPPADKDDKDEGANDDKLKDLLSSFGNVDGLDEDNIKIRQQLLDKHKGDTFDAEGNIIDENGEVVVSFDDMLAFAEGEGDTKLDEEGNQVDEDGNILKTKVDLAVDSTVINKLHADSGYEFVDEQGNTKIYTDDATGHNEFATDMASQRFIEVQEEQYNQYPELAEISKHILSGGTVDDFQAPVDYSTIDVAKLSPAEKEMYVRRSYEITGMDSARLDGLMTMFRDSNAIDSELLNAIPALEQHEDYKQEQRDNDYAAYEQQQEEETDAYWEGVSNVLTKGQLGDLTIPDSDKEAFFDYMANPVDETGNSKERLDRSNETLEQQLQMAFLRFKGYDLNKLVEHKYKVKKATTLREQLKRSAKLKDTPANDSKKRRTSGKQDVSINDLLS